jgi:predicted chitinase
VVDIQDVPGVSPVKGELDLESPAVPEKEMVKKIVTALKKYGIVNPLVQKAILSVIGKESGFKINRDEVSYRNTANSRIRKIFGKRVKDLSDNELTELKSNDTKFWDRVYGPDDPTGMSQKYGNTNKGDGSKYLGRGFNGITFKSNYKKYMDLLNKNGTVADLVNNPKLLYDPEIASEVNALYFADGLSSKLSKKKYGNEDPNDFKDFKTALKAATNANAGWGKDIEGSEDLRRAEAYSAKFDVTDISKMA